MAVAMCLGLGLQNLSLPFGRPEESEVPGSLSDAGWAGSGDLALRESPVEIGLLSAKTRTQRVKVCLGTWLFPVRREDNVCLVEMYRNIIT